jgi:hypothetical protein
MGVVTHAVNTSAGYSELKGKVSFAPHAAKKMVSWRSSALNKDVKFKVLLLV